MADENCSIDMMIKTAISEMIVDKTRLTIIVYFFSLRTFIGALKTTSKEYIICNRSKMS